MKALAGVIVLTGGLIPLTAQQGEGLAEAVRKAQEYKSYRFSVSLEITGAPEPVTVPRFEGTFEAAKGLYYAVGGEGHVARRGDRTAVRPGGSDWETLEEVAPRAPQQGFYRVILAMVRALKPPHELIKKVEAAMARVEKTREGEEDVYSGSLTEEAARKSVIFRRELQKLQNAEVTGQLKVRVGAENRLSRVNLDQRIRGSANGQDHDVTLRWTFEFKDIDAAKSEMPPEAEKLLEEP